ncbi:MAG: hypothetical protein CSA10_00295 [Cardiobacteriales bacterium]|nr:MAG: hypothetical protein CSA10_00295 [Cardiobacteriales bacterium]
MSARLRGSLHSNNYTYSGWVDGAEKACCKYNKPASKYIGKAELLTLKTILVPNVTSSDYQWMRLAGNTNL